MEEYYYAWLETALLDRVLIGVVCVTVTGLGWALLTLAGVE